MSQILQRSLEQTIGLAVKSFGTDSYTGPENPAEAQDVFIRRLSEAIAKSVQQYLITSVTVTPGQLTVGGPTTQVTTTPGILTAL
jgi:membrane protease subunit (stomatin/prohibitin family)